MDGKSIDTRRQYKSSLDVHYSSGVMNRAFCRSAKRLSGANPDTGTATVDGVKKASQAWYEANASHWTSSTQWMAGCQGVVDAATALHVLARRDLGARRLVEGRGRHLQVHPRQRLRPDADAGDGNGDGRHRRRPTWSRPRRRGNTAQSVALTITGLPSGVTGTFAPATVMSGAASTLTIATAYDTPMGDIAFTVDRHGPATHAHAAGTLTVTAPPPDLTPPPSADMATGGGTGGNGNGDNGGGGSGCSVAGRAGGSPMSALLFVAAALLLVARQRRASVRKMTATSRAKV